MTVNKNAAASTKASACKTPISTLHLQMPKGVPVATVAIGNAANAGLLAVRMLAASDAQLQVSSSAYCVECPLAADPTTDCWQDQVVVHSTLCGAMPAGYVLHLKSTAGARCPCCPCSHLHVLRAARVHI